MIYHIANRSFPIFIIPFRLLLNPYHIFLSYIKSGSWENWKMYSFFLIWNNLLTNNMNESNLFKFHSIKLVSYKWALVGNWMKKKLMRIPRKLKVNVRNDVDKCWSFCMVPEKLNWTIFDSFHFIARLVTNTPKSGENRIKFAAMY